MAETKWQKNREERREQAITLIEENKEPLACVIDTAEYLRDILKKDCVDRVALERYIFELKVMSGFLDTLKNKLNFDIGDIKAN